MILDHRQTSTGPKNGRYPVRRRSSLKPRLRVVGGGPRFSRELPFCDLRVIVPSSPHAGALGRALEASRCLAEQGAEILVVEASSPVRRSPAVRRVVARFPFARLMGPGATREVATPGTDPAGSLPDPRAFTLYASSHVCLDVRSVGRLMRALFPGGRHGAVAPALVGPDGEGLPGLSSRPVPLVWMARSASLGPPAGGKRSCAAALYLREPSVKAPELEGAAAPTLGVERLYSVTVLVPRPREVPDGRAGALECEPLAT